MCQNFLIAFDVPPVVPRSGNTNCITQTLKNLETVVGPLSINNIIQVVSKGFDFQTIPKNFTCTNCVKEAYNILKQDFGTLSDAQDAQGVQQQCGADFTGEPNELGFSGHI